jgi:hypothetical protein
MTDATDNSKKRSSRSAGERRTKLRETLWPDIKESDLWLRSQRTGFTTIPRTMSLIGQLLDRAAGKGTPVLSTYLTLWCWIYDEGIVEIRNQRELAWESGFSGNRAEGTWRTRMRRLEELGLIKTRPGLAGQFQYVLLLNPLKAIQRLYASNTDDLLYVTFLARLTQIGADDLDI